MMSCPTLNEIQEDLEEFEQLHKTAKRPKVQEYIFKEVDRLRREIITLEKKSTSKAAGVSGGQVAGGGEAADAARAYVEDIKNYCFDQSDKFMEIFLPFDNLSDINDENIHADFTDRSVTVRVHFPNKICQLHIARLCEAIVPQDSQCKKKSKHILVRLKKAVVGKTWTALTEREKKAKEKKDRPKFDENEDPGTSLTRLLQTMYDEGDDEMKRTISKAWYESRTKQNRDDPLSGL